MTTSLHHRHPAVAGSFYPDSARQLSMDVDTFLAEAGDYRGITPKALIVPHAGYIYSGPVAAHAYASLAAARSLIRRVVLLGPVHRFAVNGIALPTATCFDTPLGPVDVDTSSQSALLALPQVIQSDSAHIAEHSLEVQLPFLQKLLDWFEVLPLAVGMASPDEVAEVLDLVWGGPETLIVVSSDLSHYRPYREAQEVDQETARMILALKPLASHQQACGATPVNGLCLCAKRRGLTPHLLDLRNSGDTSGDRSRVVGYGAFAFTEEHAHAS